MPGKILLNFNLSGAGTSARSLFVEAKQLSPSVEAKQMTLFGTDLGAQAFQVCNFGGGPGTGLFCNTLEINTLQFSECSRSST